MVVVFKKGTNHPHSTKLRTLGKLVNVSIFSQQRTDPQCFIITKTEDDITHDCLRLFCANVYCIFPFLFAGTISYKRIARKDTNCSKFVHPSESSCRVADKIGQMTFSSRAMRNNSSKKPSFAQALWQ